MLSSRRLLGLAAAVLLTTASLAATGANPASAAGSTDAFAPAKASARAMPAGSGQRPVARTSWPVGSRTGTLAREQGVTPAGDPSQNLVSVTVAQKRAASTIQAAITLAAAPTAETDSRLRVAFGKVTDDGAGGAICQPTATSYVDVHSFDVDATGTTGNPSYDGARVVIKPTTNELARNAAWDCAYVLTLSLDGTVLYDSFIGSLVDHIQKPQLSIVVPGKQLEGTGYTRVPIKIVNSRATIATAPAVRLAWQTVGVSVRANKDVGSIRPGSSKKGFFYVKDTRRGTGKIIFTVISNGYRKSLTLKVRQN